MINNFFMKTVQHSTVPEQRYMYSHPFRGYLSERIPQQSLVRTQQELIPQPLERDRRR